MRLIFLILIILLALSFPRPVDLVSMTSENYQIFVDVVSVGGDLSTSTNYKVFNTLGEAAGVSPTQSTSTNYIIEAGFQVIASTTYVSAALSTNAVSLGKLSTTIVASASQGLIVSTNAHTGYIATIQEDGNLRSGSDDIDDVTDGSVTAGYEEYGLRTSGAAGQMNNADTAITAVAQTVAASSAAIIGESTGITYKAAVSSLTAHGSYSHTTTITTAVNY